MVNSSSIAIFMFLRDMSFEGSKRARLVKNCIQTSFGMPKRLAYWNPRSEFRFKVKLQRGMLNFNFNLRPRPFYVFRCSFWRGVRICAPKDATMTRKIVFERNTDRPNGSQPFSPTSTCRPSVSIEHVQHLIRICRSKKKHPGKVDSFHVFDIFMASYGLTCTPKSVNYFFKRPTKASKMFSSDRST